MNGKELLNFANKLEDDHKDKGYKWLYDKLRYEIIKKHQEAINFIPCCETLKDEGQATLTEYATELINMQENPQDSNKDWKIVVMQNTIGKLHETIKSL
jgi:hypothetical protein